MELGARIRVHFLIRSLDVGGAERQLCTLVRHLDKDRFDLLVTPMYGGGALEAGIHDVPGLRLESLEKRGRWDMAHFGVRLAKLSRAFRPHIVHPYMGGANEIGLGVAALVRSRLIWGLRVSDLDLSRYRRSVRTVFALGRRLSRWPDLIIANSYRGREVHIAAGYEPSRMIVIPNGIDTGRFLPSPARGREWRLRHGLNAETTVIGYPARFDPMKDHGCFLRAAAIFHAQAAPAGKVRFVAMGDGPDEYRSRLMRQAEELGIAAIVTWLPADPDPVAAYNGCDIITSSSSYGEGFPNILGEAMSCGRPCVTTDVGDAARIVGALGAVVAPGDAPALARAWGAVGPPDQSSGGPSRRRERILAEFSVARLVERTDRALVAVASDRAAEFAASWGA